MKHLLKITGAFAALMTSVGVAAPAQADDRYIGDVMLVGFNFCPRYTLEANGAILPINTHQALYSLYGTMYGGDGRTSFGLPDLRGRIPVSYGQSPGYPAITQGQRIGSETVRLSAADLPGHSHHVYGTTHEHSEETPQDNTLATFNDGQTPYSTGPIDTPMASGVVSREGQSLPYTNMAPTTTLRYCIVTDGLFPPRS